MNVQKCTQKLSSKELSKGVVFLETAGLLTFYLYSYSSLWMNLRDECYL